MKETVGIITSLRCGELRSAGFRRHRHRGNFCPSSFERLVICGVHHRCCFARSRPRKDLNFLTPIELSFYAGVETHRTYYMRLYHSAAVRERTKRPYHLHWRYRDALPEGCRIIA